jgi:hypothetical protein
LSLFIWYRTILMVVRTSRPKKKRNYLGGTVTVGVVIFFCLVFIKKIINFFKTETG